MLDHIFGNPHLFSHFNNFTSLSFITSANGLKTIVKTISNTKPLSNVSLDFVLYVLYCPFNLMPMSKLTYALNCSSSFDIDSIFIHNWGIG